MLKRKIELTVTDAFRMDYNLIVEEFDLYQTLTPKMQTELINKIFSKFIKRFKHFFNSCEIGFRNEFIIQLYARVYPPNKLIMAYGKEPEEIVMVLAGNVQMLTEDNE